MSEYTTAHSWSDAECLATRVLVIRTRASCFIGILFHGGSNYK